MTDPPITREEWLALSEPARRLAWDHWTPDEQDAMRGQFTATTPGDGLRYPNDYNAPADSPAAFRDLANDTQTALDKRVTTTGLSIGTISLGSGWKVGSLGAPTVDRTGRVCIPRGSIARSAVLDITDDTIVLDIATVPVGWRPTSSTIAAVAWLGQTSGGNVEFNAGHLGIGTDGKVSFRPNLTGSMQVDHWISLGGITWIGAG